MATGAAGAEAAGAEAAGVEAAGAEAAGAAVFSSTVAATGRWIDCEAPPAIAVETAPYACIKATATPAVCSPPLVIWAMTISRVISPITLTSAGSFTNSSADSGSRRTGTPGMTAGRAD